MTQQELFAQLAAGNYSVTSKEEVKGVTSRTGTVQQILFYGKYISVSVLFPGSKFEVNYHENETVSHAHVRYLKELV